MSGITTPGLPLATALTGAELFAADTQLGQGITPESEAISIAQVAAFAGFAGIVIGTADNGTTQTLTAAMVTGTNASRVFHTSTGGATPSLTMPLATAIIAGEGPNFTTGASYVLRVINGNSGTATLVTNTGITTSGTLTVAAGAWREFLISATSSTAVTMTSIGTGTNS